MKFWQAKQDFNPASKFIFNGPPGTSTGPGEDIEYSDTEREAALAESHDELASLRSSLEEGQEKLDIPTNDQVEILRRLARRESIQDIINKSDQSWAQSFKDTVGRVYEIGGDYSKEELEEMEAYHESRIEHQFLKMVSSEAILRFIQDYRIEAQSLFTDQTGDGQYRAEFYANTLVGRNVNFMDLYSMAEAPYIRVGGITYARTPSGYKSFYDGRNLASYLTGGTFNVGDIASVQSGTVYEVVEKGDLTEDESEILEEFKNGENKHPEFAVLNDPKILELEYNREKNFYMSQNWKLFAGRMVETYSKEPFTNFKVPELVDQARGTFEQLKIYLDAGNTNLDAIAGVTLSPLDRTEKPSEFLKKINNSISQVYDKLHSQLSDARADLRGDLENSDFDPTDEGLMLAQVKEKEVGAIISSLDGNLEEFVTEQAENNKQATEQVSSELEQKLKENFTESELAILKPMIDSLLENPQEFRTKLLEIYAFINAKKGKKVADEFYNLLENKHRVTLRSTMFEEVVSHQKFLQVKQELFAKLGGNFLLQEAFQTVGIATPSDLTSEKLAAVKSVLERKMAMATPAEARRIREALPELNLLAADLSEAEITREVEEADISRRVERLETIGREFYEITHERELIETGQITPEEAKETFWGEVEEKTEEFRQLYGIEKDPETEGTAPIEVPIQTLNLPPGVKVDGADPKNPGLYVVSLGENGQSEYRLDPTRGLIHKDGLDTPFAQNLYIQANNPAGAMAMGGLIKSQYLTGTDRLAFDTRSFGNLEMNELFSVMFAKRNSEPLPASEAQSWETLGVAMQKSKTSFGQIIDALAGESTTNAITQERSITAEDMGAIESGLDDLLAKARTMTADQLATHLTALSTKLLP